MKTMQMGISDYAKMRTSDFYGGREHSSAWKRIVRNRIARKRKQRRFVTTFLVFCAVICLITAFAVFSSAIRSNAGNGFKYYTSVVIEPGDTLWDLADEYIDYNNYRDKRSYIDEVMSINHLVQDGEIYAGQRLILPYYSTEYVY